MEKLEVFAVQEDMLDSMNLVLVVKVNDKWCKPMREIGGTFDKQMADPNSGIINALWRFDPLTDKKVDVMFDAEKELDSFELRRLEEFQAKHK